MAAKTPRKAQKTAKLLSFKSPEILDVNSAARFLTVIFQS
jgi:hypothetical protein